MSNPLPSACRLCGAAEFVRIDTYKRLWSLCNACGSGQPTQKDSYPLAFLPGAAFKRHSKTQESMYDYFVQPAHIQYSIGTAHEFLRDYIDPLRIDLRGRKVLDVSGGNGHFLKVLTEERGCIGVLTEINEPSLEYVRKQHGFEAFAFDFNRDRLSTLTTTSYDLILLRAAIMFCDDLPAFIADASACLAPGGLMIVNHSVKPTLGVLCRTQLDEFSYKILRQPETVAADFARAGYELVFRRDETDPSDYVYGHDELNSWLFLHYLYEIRGALALRRHRAWGFPARDRRRSTLVFRKP